MTVPEMAWNPVLPYACGDPDGVFDSLLPELSRTTVGRVLEEAANTGAPVLVTVCPVTRTLFEMANHTKLKVRDIVAAVADAVVGPDAAAPH